MAEDSGSVLIGKRAGVVRAVLPVQVGLPRELLAGDVLLVGPTRIEDLEGGLDHKVRRDALDGILVHVLDTRGSVHCPDTDFVTSGKVRAGSELELDALDGELFPGLVDLGKAPVGGIRIGTEDGIGIGGHTSDTPRWSLPGDRDPNLGVGPDLIRGNLDVDDLDVPALGVGHLPGL